MSRVTRLTCVTRRITRRVHIECAHIWCGRNGGELQALLYACAAVERGHEYVPGKAGRGVTSLASEIEQLYTTPSPNLLDGSSVRCGVRCCLDLAAVRGMRG
eukprot:2457337-Pleurochrysis_carterae.AAC.1